MKKFIYRISIYLFIVILIDIAFGYTCDFLYRYSKCGDTYKITYSIFESTPDVLIMGSSRACHHYNPYIMSDSLKLSCLNLGIDGSGTILMDGFYQMIAKRHVPRIVLYELTPLFDIYEYEQDAHNTRYLAKLKPFYREECLKQIFDDVDRKEFLKLHSGLYRHNTQFLNIMRFYFSPDIELNNGFLPLDGIMKCIPEKKVHEKKNVDHIKLKYLKKLIEDCKRHGSTLIFTISPSFGEKNYDDFQPALDIASEMDIPVINHYCDENFVQNLEFFKDSGHLNKTGADIYSSTISNEIKKMITENNK